MASLRCSSHRSWTSTVHLLLSSGMHVRISHYARVSLRTVCAALRARSYRFVCGSAASMVSPLGTRRWLPPPHSFDGSSGAELRRWA